MPRTQRLPKFLHQGLEPNIQIQLNLIQDSVLAIIPQPLLLLHTTGQETPELTGHIWINTSPWKSPQQKHSLCLFSQIVHEKVSNLVQTCQNVSSFSNYLTLLGKESLLIGIKQWKNAEEYEMQWTQAARRETPLRYCERHLLKKGGQTPEEFAQRSCGSSIPGDSQNSAGSNPKHNLSFELVLLSAGNQSRWPPEVSLRRLFQFWLVLTRKKNPFDFGHYKCGDSNIHPVKFPFPDLLLVSSSNN